ncbi:MAG: hypothetical protein ACOYL6_12645 [Bacteriovoracaceae bacterium]
MKTMKLLLILMITVSYSMNSHSVAVECDGQFSYKIEGVTPFAQAFPETMIKEGTLTARMNDFKNRWPNNVKLVNNVKMKVQLGTSNPTRLQDFFIISTNGMDEARKTELMNDYLNSVSNESLSFPLGSQAGHLYTRVGNKTMDNLNSMSVNEYRTGYSDRLETMVALTPAEFDNLRWYAHHASTNHANVIGTFSYNGTKETVGKIDNNKCSRAGEGHNCTSWLGLAPIGKDGEPFKEMIGAHGWDIAGNPGWLTAFIHAYTPKSRFPFVVYMSDDPMAELSELIKTNKQFNWEYYLH